MNLKRHIPNLLTLGNLLCGCFAVVLAVENNLVASAYLVGIALVLDFLDGFMARMLQVHSEIGKQLDSLADMVTFGVVPGIIMFQLLKFSFLFSSVSEYSKLEQLSEATVVIPFLAFLIPLFSAWRLAKFNIDPRQTDSFIGVPTPANALLICSLPLIMKYQTDTLGGTLYAPLSALENALNMPALATLELFLIHPFFLCALTLLMSFLLVSEIPLFALKFKSFSWAENKIRYIFLFLSLLLLIFFQFLGIAFSIFLYIILSFIHTRVRG